jgi:hypothetical protein
VRPRGVVNIVNINDFLLLFLVYDSYADRLRIAGMTLFCSDTQGEAFVYEYTYSRTLLARINYDERTVSWAVCGVIVSISPKFLYGDYVVFFNSGFVK